MLTTTPPARPSLRMTEPQYVDWAKANESSEWVDGEVVLKMPVEENHDEIQRLLAGVIELFAKRRKLGKVRGPEFTTRLVLGSKVVRRDPDVMFISSEHASRLLPTYLDGPPDLVIEVVSAESEFCDFNEKFREYEQAGVREYWIVNPLSRVIHLFIRDAATGTFTRREADVEGRFHSTVIDGVWFHPDDLFTTDRPDVLDLVTKIDPALLA